MRLFIAIDLPSSVKEKIAQLIKTLKKLDLEAKWVETANLHLSLKFLGEVEEKNTEEIKRIVADVAVNASQFEINLYSFGFFPNEKYPRVFFVATDKEDVLRNIAVHLEDRLAMIGFPKENRFKSHITLARFKGIKNIDLLKAEMKNIAIEEKSSVEEIALFKSTLTKTGPIYEKIFKVSLRP
jgi:2'-5' RNA ligase